MPRIETENAGARSLRGLHLYHAGWSNCSMRVRMTLDEKGLEWTSHHLNTRKGEHITPEYFSINPNGLVPTLVHDGDVWIESADIIRHLDDTYPEPRLTPIGIEDRAKMSEWTALASSIHVRAVKTYIYSTRPADKRRKTRAELDRYRRLQSNEELLEFHARNSSVEGLGNDARRNAERLLDDAFAMLDTHLDSHIWLAGTDFSLADITWVPLHYTLDRAGFPLDEYPNLQGWAEAIAARPSYRTAVLEWYGGEPG